MSETTTVLQTPVLFKEDDDFDWPSDVPLFYLLTRDGLYRCRNHPFFKSCVWVAEGPGELAAQEQLLLPNYPRIPQDLFERIVGYFARVAELHGSEAGVFLAWDRGESRVRIVVPDQEATVSRGWYGDVYPIGLHYKHPTDLPADQVIFGDVHSHVKGPAYASSTDVHDEIHRPGLHIVVGHIHLTPPSWHVEAVVDSTRFRMNIDEVIEGYEAPDLDIPQDWLDKVEVVSSLPLARDSWSKSGAAYDHGHKSSR